MKMFEWEDIGVKTAARLIGVRPEKVRQLLKAGKLKGQKVNGVWEIPRKQLTRQRLLPFDKYQDGE
jgi:hypothetical protein